METAQLLHGRQGPARQRATLKAAICVNSRFRDGVGSWCGFFTLLIALSCGRVGREECYHPELRVNWPEYGYAAGDGIEAL